MKEKQLSAKGFSNVPFRQLSNKRSRVTAKTIALIMIILICTTPLFGYLFRFQTGTATFWPKIAAADSTSGQPPIIIGWGGVGIDESVSSDYYCTLTSETCMQNMMRTLAGQGYNGIRVDFEPTCTTPPDNYILGKYNTAELSRSISFAKTYGLWIVVDYHGYTEFENQTTLQCWLGFWKSLVQNFTATYSQIIWEPINEPHMISNTNVTGLSADYQLLINEVRSVGDTHWIVVQNLCSSVCGFTNLTDGYPIVTDSSQRVFISLHSYMGYQWYSSHWNITAAESLAQQFYSAVLAGSRNTGWPVLNTEGGPDPQMPNCSKGVNLPSGLCAPDQVLVGSAGYSRVTLDFIQELTNLYDSNTPNRINWIWWPAGSWTDTPGAADLGALAPNGWGSLLAHKVVDQSSSSSEICIMCWLSTSLTLASSTLGSKVFLIASGILAALGVSTIALRSRTRKNRIED